MLQDKNLNTIHILSVKNCFFGSQYKHKYINLLYTHDKICSRGKKFWKRFFKNI